MSDDKELTELMDLSGDSESDFETLSLTSGRESRDYDDFSEYGNNDNEDSVIGGKARSQAAHACVYCGESSPASVVRCLTTNKWFCNGKGGSLNSSHIVAHLVKSRNKTVALHPDSEVGSDVLECYNCGNENVFVLGFVTAKLENVVVLLCRHCIQRSPSDANWDIREWQTLIEDRQFLPWLVPIPRRCESRVTMADVIKAEEAWKTNPSLSWEDALQGNQEEQDEEEEIAQVKATYEDAYEYQRTYGPLVKIEADYDKNMKESQRQTGLTVSWNRALNNNYLCTFYLNLYDLTGTKITVGDEVKLYFEGSESSSTPRWSGTGIVVKTPDNFSEEVTLEIRKGGDEKQIPTGESHPFALEFVWNDITYRRMQQALKLFATDDYSVSGYIYHNLLGHDIPETFLDVPLPEQFSIQGFNELNVSQVNAVKQVLRRPFSLIQGPPGTGKTVVSTTIIYHLANIRRQNPEKGSKILVCAPSNVAVDQLAERIASTGVDVLRLTARSRESMSSSVEHLTIQHALRHGDHGFTRLQKLFELKDELGEFSAADEKEFAKLEKKASEAIIRKAEVICCTCSTAGNFKLQNLTFSAVLIDEVTQASEPECLIPLVHGCKQVVFVGDHQQLGPVILNSKAADAGLNKSLFERLILIGHVPIRLTVQYRMHPSLSEFPSNMFYEGSLQNGVTTASRVLKYVDFPWPQPQHPMLFWSNLGQEEISASGTSFLNRTEAANCERIVTRLFKCGVAPEQIGVVTPYEGQRAYVTQYMVSSGSVDEAMYKGVEVQSVDAFQGREKDFIILTCVRSSKTGGIGFLSDPRRLNVALTRAKYGLIILGNPHVLARHPLWLHLITYFRSKRCLVEGPLSALQPCNIQLPKPRPWRANNRFDKKDKAEAVGGGGAAGSVAGDDYSVASSNVLSEINNQADDEFNDGYSSVFTGGGYQVVDTWGQENSGETAISESLSQRLDQISLEDKKSSFFPMR